LSSQGYTYLWHKYLWYKIGFGAKRISNYRFQVLTHDIGKK